MKVKSLRFTIRALLLLPFLITVAPGHAKAQTNQMAAPPVSSQSARATPISTPTPPVLEIVLEGPFAICSSPKSDSKHIEILVPKALHHGPPGFDSDQNEIALCSGSYQLTFQHTSESGAQFPKDYDTVHAECPPRNLRYEQLSLLLDKPDDIRSLNEADAIVSVDQSNDPERKYPTRTALYYYSVDLKSLKLLKLGSSVCVSPVPIIFPDSIHFTDLSIASQSGHLTFMMVPSREDATGGDAEKAYHVLAELLGLNRTVNVRPPQITKHGMPNDCLAPQMVVLPPKSH